MRGPSSSHCAAALRIGHIARDLMGGRIDSVHVQFDPRGSLATTHTSQGSDMGLFGGLMGWEATDERLPYSAEAIADAGIEISIQIKSFNAPHPNTYMLKLINSDSEHEIVALSTGGGMIEVIAIDGVAMTMIGDYFETMVAIKGPVESLVKTIKENAENDGVFVLEGQWVEVKSQTPLDVKLIQTIKQFEQVKSIHIINPVLPVLSHKNLSVPFITSQGMIQSAKAGESLWELAVQYESRRGNITHDQVLMNMRKIVQILDKSVASGLQGTDYKDRILKQQSDSYQLAMSRSKLLDTGILNLITLYITALMEMKSSMGVIVAAPTAGSCGGLPGAVLAAAEKLGYSVEEKVKALLAGGMIGVFIAEHATFAAEVGGCQAECGAGSGMAAAALVDLMGGNVEEAVTAASLALQNTFGMTCDPVANRVEVPCLGKNVMAAANAVTCANMALAGFDAVIPLDEVIEAMHVVGMSLPAELRCTALGGLSVTDSSKRIEKKLAC
ncbi:L-serine ammonia-lyase, iron-sulfur-dependent, subunit alpha [bacterium]|nr:L-serine ammonia-lyase, iron-sulfur-dependent, subunit alpha [bacterium]